MGAPPSRRSTQPARNDCYQQHGGRRNRHPDGLRLVSRNPCYSPTEIEEKFMDKATAALAGFSAAVLVALPTAVSAQEQQSFKSIVGRGFEIKNVAFAKGEATENREVFVVTLQ